VPIRTLNALYIIVEDFGVAVGMNADHGLRSYADHSADYVQSSSDRGGFSAAARI
jgi:hypothetical protein